MIDETSIPPGAYEVNIAAPSSVDVRDYWIAWKARRQSALHCVRTTAEHAEILYERGAVYAVCGALLPDARVSEFEVTFVPWTARKCRTCIKLTKQRRTVG